MPTYAFKCTKCNENFEEIHDFSAVDAGFPDVHCPKCNSKKIEKNLFLFGDPPGAVFSDAKNSSKWDNWSYRQGMTANQAKMERAAAEAAVGGKSPYKQIDDTNGGRRMNFIE